jgi:hypothetical protein
MKASCISSVRPHALVAIRRLVRNEALTGCTCLAEAFSRQVQPSELIRHLLALSFCPPPASVLRSTLPRLPCEFQPTMYPFIRRHDACSKLQLSRVRGKLDELALLLKPTEEGAGSLEHAVSTKFSRLCERVTAVYRSFRCVSTSGCSSQKPSQGEACIICFQLACCLSSRHAKKSTRTTSAKSSPLASRILST